ncbi:MAG: hypothetical protein AAGK74_14955, partial [Chloroflexota bacterium]
LPPQHRPVRWAEEALSPEMQELATKLTESASETREDVIERLRNAAAGITSVAGDTSSDALKQRSADLARGLEEAADMLEGKPTSIPGPQPPTRPNYTLIVVMFVLGIFAGIWMRSSSND